MKPEPTKEEEFVKKFGWEKVKGFVLDLELIRDLPEHWDKAFFQSLDDYVEECEFWHNNNDYVEEAFDDIDDVIDFIENNSEEKFEDVIKN